MQLNNYGQEEAWKGPNVRNIPNLESKWWPNSPWPSYNAVHPPKAQVMQYLQNLKGTNYSLPSIYGNSQESHYNNFNPVVLAPQTQNFSDYNLNQNYTSWNDSYMPYYVKFPQDVLTTSTEVQTTATESTLLVVSIDDSAELNRLPLELEKRKTNSRKQTIPPWEEMDEKWRSQSEEVLQKSLNGFVNTDSQSKGLNGEPGRAISIKPNWKIFFVITFQYYCVLNFS